MRCAAVAACTLTAIVTWSITGTGQAAAPQEVLDGLDPVLLMQGREVDGKPDLRVVHGGYDYRFSSPETKAAFEREPAKFAVQLNGLCARMGKTAMGNPADFVVHEGRIYLMGSDDCHKKFAAAPATYLAAPAPAMPTSQQAVAKGRALLDTAAAAAGGARLDAMATFVEALQPQVQRRPQGEVTVTLKTMWSFPESVRLERSMVGMDRKMTSATILAPGGAWSTFQDRAFPLNAAGRPSVDQDLLRHPVVLLRNRRAPGVSAAALEPAVVDGTRVERVRIRRGGMDVTLHLVPASGQVHSVTFVDRNLVGEVGTYTLLYSDFRDVEGVSAPFQARALFNGAPDPMLSSSTESVAVGVRLEAALFAPPAGTK